jgi:putative transposase
LFKDEADRTRFLERLSERVEQYHIRIFRFVCMTNHFRMVFETPEANCSRFMHSVSAAYEETLARPVKPAILAALWI